VAGVLEVWLQVDFAKVKVLAFLVLTGKHGSRVRGGVFAAKTLFPETVSAARASHARVSDPAAVGGYMRKRVGKDSVRAGSAPLTVA
jgi:hypothetical protein